VEGIMSREVWGTYSVKDHLNPTAFLADLILYDRLVLPVPEEQLDDRAKAAWAGWNAPLQRVFVEVLERADRVRTIPWRVGQWEEGKEALPVILLTDPGLMQRLRCRQAAMPFFTHARGLSQACRQGCAG
jgi:hypothetical protein